MSDEAKIIDSAIARLRGAIGTPAQERAEDELRDAIAMARHRPASAVQRTLRAWRRALSRLGGRRQTGSVGMDLLYCLGMIALGTAGGALFVLAAFLVGRRLLSLPEEVAHELAWREKRADRRARAAAQRIEP